MYCLYVAYTAYFISNIQIRHAELVQGRDDNDHLLTWTQWLYAITMYLPAVCLLSSTTVVDAIANSVPPDENIMHMSSSGLSAIQSAVAPVLFLVKAYVLPFIARLTIRVVTGSSDGFVSSQMRFIILARIFLTMVVPCISTLMTSQNCEGFWLLLWTTCQSPSQLDQYTDYKYTVGSYVGVNNIPIVQGTAICGSNYRLLP